MGAAQRHDARQPDGTGGYDHQGARAELEPRFDGLMPEYLKTALQADKAAFVEMGAPEKLAQRLANLQLAGIMPDIALIAHLAGADRVVTAKTYFGVSEAFRIGRIEEAARSSPRHGLL